MATPSKRSLSEAAETDEHPTYKSNDKDDKEERSEDGLDMNAPPTDVASNDKDEKAEESARRDDRLKKNRQKARDRRTRKKTLVEDMQRNVVVLSRMNSELRRKNQDLIRQLAQYGAAGHPGSLGGAEGYNPLVGANVTMTGAQQGAGIGSLTGQSALGMTNGSSDGPAAGQTTQAQLQEGGAKPVSSVTSGMDVSAILSQFPGAAAQAGSIANATAAPTSLPGLQLGQMANNLPLMTLLGQQQALSGLSDTSQQLAALQGALSGGAPSQQLAALQGALSGGAAPMGAPVGAPMGSIQASNALGLDGATLQAAAAAADSQRPVHIVVHHHHPDGSQTTQQ